MCIYTAFTPVSLLLLLSNHYLCAVILKCTYHLYLHKCKHIYIHMLNVQMQYIQRVMCLQLNIMCNIYIYVYIYTITYSTIHIYIYNYSRYSEPCPSDPIPAWASEGLDLTVQCRHLDDDVVCRHGPLDL